MKKLVKRDFKKVIPLFAEFKDQVVIGSVIEGNTPGVIYVDDIDDPKSALLWNRMDALVLGGAEDNIKFNEELNNLLKNELIPDAMERYIPVFTIYYPENSWENKLDIILDGLDPEKVVRKCFRMNQLKYNWRENIPSDFTIQPISKEFLNKTGLENKNSVIGWIMSFWPSLEIFTEKGVGFCLHNDDIIVSWCLSVFVSGNQFEFGLETDKRYRNRGFAKLVASACLEYCCEHNLEPHWHCSAQNRPSALVAESIGFEEDFAYSVHSINLVKLKERYNR